MSKAQSPATKDEPAHAHGKGPDLQKKLDDAKAKLQELLVERDKEQARTDKEAAARDDRKKWEQERAGRHFDEAEWLKDQKPIHKVPEELQRTLHKQHYVVAAIERELDELARVGGPAAMGGLD